MAQLFFIGAAVITLLLAAEVTDFRALIAQRDAVAARAEQRRRRLEALGEHAADVAVVVDQRGVVTYASPNVSGLLGPSDPGDAAANSALHWVHPDDRADATGWLQAVLDGAAGASRRVELRLRRGDGSAVWVEAVASNRVDEPSVGGVVLNLRDVTLRRRSEELNRALFEAMWEGAVLLDARGVIIQVDGSTGELLGTTPASLLGRRASELIPEAFRADALRRLRDQRTMLFSGPAKRSQQALPYAHPDGSVRWFSVSAAALREADGSVSGYAVLLADLTEFHDARRARRVAEHRYRSIVESSQEGIALTGPDGRITFANGRAAILCGYGSADELVGRPLGELFDRQGAAPYPDGAHRAPGEAATWPRCRLRRADGAIRWMHWTVSDITVDDPWARREPDVRSTPERSDRPDRPDRSAVAGVEAGTMHVFLDVTDQVELEERRGTMAAELALAAEQERRLLAADLHDGPIQRLAATAIQLGSAAVAHADQPTLAEALLRAEALVRGTTTELRQLLFQLAPPDLTESGLAMAVGRAADMLLGSVGVRVEVRAELDEQPHPAVALAAYRIVQEALSNVRVHAGAAEVVLTLRRQAGGLLVAVRDDGVGCEAAELHASRPGHLGIRSMRQRADDLGGWCRVDSTPGLGTTVTLWLPSRPDGHRGAPTAPGPLAPAVQDSAAPAERQS